LPFQQKKKYSDEEQQQSLTVTPVSSIKRVESTSFSLDYVPSRSNKHYQQVHDEQIHANGTTKIIGTKKKRSHIQRQDQDYDNLDNITKTKHKVEKEMSAK
jgi:hypothetical protein